MTMDDGADAFVCGEVKRRAPPCRRSGKRPSPFQGKKTILLGHVMGSMGLGETRWNAARNPATGSASATGCVSTASLLGLWQKASLFFVFEP